MSFNSTVTIHGDDKVVTRIRSIQRRAASPSTQLWNRVGSYVRKQYAEQFKTQGAHLGRPWSPLKPQYAAWKLKQGRGANGILVYDGGLRDSYVKKMEASTIRISDKIYEFGSHHKLAPFHHFGTHSHRTGKPILPPRKVAVVTPQMREDVADIVAQYIAGKGRKIGSESGSDE